MIAKNNYAGEEHLSMLGELGDDAHSVLLRCISKSASTNRLPRKVGTSQKWSPTERTKVLEDWKNKIKATKTTKLSQIDDRPLKR